MCASYNLCAGVGEVEKDKKKDFWKCLYFSIKIVLGDSFANIKVYPDQAKAKATSLQTCRFRLVWVDPNT